MRRGLAWYQERDGNIALRLAAAGTSPRDLHMEHPYGDGSVPVGFPGSVPLLPNRQVVATAVLPRDKKTYWKLEYWADATERSALDYYTKAFEQGGWTLNGPRRVGREGSEQGGWMTYARKDGLEVEMYLFPRGSSDRQAISLTVEEPRG
ncbi:MAG: hypothetical protein ABI972_20090 [Acidobacteriota bacterium]